MSFCSLSPASDYSQLTCQSPVALVIELLNLFLLLQLVTGNLVFVGFLHLSFSCKQNTLSP